MSEFEYLILGRSAEHPDWTPIESDDSRFPAAVRALEEMVEEDHTSSTVANHIFSLWDAAK